MSIRPFSAALLLTGCIASLRLAMYSCRQQDATRRGSDKRSNKDFANFTTITYFLATSLLPHSSHSAQDGTWVPHIAVVTCRNLAGLYKLQDLEDSKVVTLAGSPVTPNPPVLRRPRFSPAGFKAQHVVVLGMELLGGFIPWSFYPTRASSSASSFLIFFFYAVVFGAIRTSGIQSRTQQTPLYVSTSP